MSKGFTGCPSVTFLDTEIREELQKVQVQAAFTMQLFKRNCIERRTSGPTASHENAEVRGRPLLYETRL